MAYSPVLDYFPEKAEEKVHLRTSLSSMTVSFEPKGQATIRIKNRNLYEITFNGMKRPEEFNGLFTSMASAQKALREYIDTNSIKVSNVDRHVLMHD